MKRKIIQILVVLFLFPSVMSGAETRKGGGQATYILDGDAAPIPFELNVGSMNSSALPSNTFSDDQKLYLRTILVQNPNANALYISTMSGFVPRTNPAALIPGSTGSMTLNNNATYYLRYGSGVSSETVHGLITRTTVW